VGGKIYKESTIEDCLNKASEELGIPKERLNYTIIEEKKGFFKKSVSISVETQEKINVKNGTVKVEMGSIIVKNPEEGGRPAAIEPCEGIELVVNGEEILKKREIFEGDTIQLNFEEKEAKRLVNLIVSTDKMAAYISIGYTPKIIYTLKDSVETNFLSLEVLKKEEKFPPLFTEQEIKAELQKLGICSGIIDENLLRCAKERNITNLIIAQGTPVTDDTDDMLEVKFNISPNPLELVEDSSGKIDFRNLGSIGEVKKGDLLGVKIPGAFGSDGLDIYGNIVKKKDKRNIILRVGGGCLLQDENTVVAAMDGKPCVKNNVFYVYQVHEVTKDVDLKTGNVNFIGDVKIYGTVREGMKVEAGNSAEIGQDVEHAQISAKGNITIGGNVIVSKIAAGGEDITIQRLITNLNELRTTIRNMVDAIMEVKRFNLLGEKITDGEMIKLLIETKFKSIPKLGMCIIRDTLLQQSNHQDEVVSLIRQKLIGMASLSIYHFSELDEITEAVDQRIKQLEGLLSLPVNINMAYCQDSDITSSGDIFITGKGAYISRITANHGIYFLEERAVARGGVIRAREEIKCRSVGSTGGVSTKLWVEEKGHIWADVAFQNTTFSIGIKEYILEKPSKNVHAYMDQSGDLVVDKLCL
jgi:uncharacterized protein